MFGSKILRSGNYNQINSSLQPLCSDKEVFFISENTGLAASSDLTDSFLTMKLIAKPEEGEFPPYASMYIRLLPDDKRLLHHLKTNFFLVKELILSLPQEKLNYRYAEKKWTIREVLVHIIDDERIYAYRAMCFARNEKKELPSFEQDEYAFFSGANQRDITNILEEYEAVRNSTITLFNGLAEEAFLRTGVANNNKVSVRALAYHIAGHELHHVNIIKEKYLK